jgi:hypothetical protein
MSTKPHKPEPSEWLRLLTGNRLQTQVSRSGALEGGALGVMGLDVACRPTRSLRMAATCWVRMWGVDDRTTKGVSVVVPLRRQVKGAASRLAVLGPVGPPLTGRLRFTVFAARGCA